MAQTYRLTGTQDPASRLDRWVVEGPSEDYPDGKVLTLGGEPLELSDEQYAVGSRYVRLEPVESGQEADVQFVDQPGVDQPSLSTDNPPDPGTVPEIERMDREQLLAEARRVGVQAHGNASKDELKRAIQAKRAEG